MGYKTTEAVLDALCGRELTAERTSAKSGKKSVKKFSAQDMALLLTVAARQFDPMACPNDSDPIWYASEGKVCDFVHFKRSSLYDSRNFLVKLGLLNYWKSKRHFDYKNPSKERTYYDVYQVCLKKLKSMIDADVRNTDADVRSVDENVRNTDGDVRNTDVKVRNTDIHTDSIDTAQQTNKQTPSLGDDEYLRRVIKAIANSLRVEESTILPKVVAEAIQGKFPDSVFGVIQDPNGWFRSAKKPINALISVLHKLPLQANDPEYRRQTLPTVKELLETVHPDVRCLIEDSMKNTKCESPLFVQQLIRILYDLLQTHEGRRFAVEIIDENKANTVKDSQNTARRLLQQLRAGVTARREA